MTNNIYQFFFIYLYSIITLFLLAIIGDFVSISIFLSKNIFIYKNIFLYCFLYAICFFAIRIIVTYQVSNIFIFIISLVLFQESISEIPTSPRDKAAKKEFP